MGIGKSMLLIYIARSFQSNAHQTPMAQYCDHAALHKPAGSLSRKHNSECDVVRRQLRPDGINKVTAFLRMKKCSFTFCTQMFCPPNLLPPWPVIGSETAWWFSAGNMAGESAAVRSRLQANGAVKPLLQLLLAAEGDPELRTLASACTAAWALSNLLQDQSHAVSCFPLSLSPYSSCFACISLPCRRFAQYAMVSMPGQYAWSECVVSMDGQYA